MNTQKLQRGGFASTLISVWISSGYIIQAGVSGRRPGRCGADLNVALTPYTGALMALYDQNYPNTLRVFVEDLSKASTLRSVAEGLDEPVSFEFCSLELASWTRKEILQPSGLLRLELTLHSSPALGCRGWPLRLVWKAAGLELFPACVELLLG